MLDGQALVLRRVVLEVERPRSAQLHHRVPEERERDVRKRSVLLPLEVVQNCIGLLAAEHYLADVLVRVEIGRSDLLLQAQINGIVLSYRPKIDGRPFSTSGSSSRGCRRSAARDGSRGAFARQAVQAC